jgi:putative DNA primase/helicase
MGDEGKTTLTNVIQDIVLPKGVAVCEADAERALSEHGVASFPDARVLVLTEANREQSQRNVDDKKRMSGGDGIMINPKHAAMLADKVNFKLLEVCNHPAPFKDGTDDNAIKNRYQYIQVYPAPKDKRRDNLKDKLVDERDYFVTMCIKGIARMQKNKYKFTACKKDDDVKEEVFGNTPVAAFLSDMYIEDRENDEAFEPVVDMKRQYNKWANENGCDCKFKQLKQGIVNRGFPFGRKHVNGAKQNPYGFRGLKPRSDD